MSRHLRRLRASGLVETLTADEPDARLRVYRLRPEPFVSLKD
jgi:DNA-binding transcriptional ArsR family regulator